MPAPRIGLGEARGQGRAGLDVDAMDDGQHQIAITAQLIAHGQVQVEHDASALARLHHLPVLHRAAIQILRGARQGTAGSRKVEHETPWIAGREGDGQFLHGLLEYQFDHLAVVVALGQGHGIEDVGGVARLGRGGQQQRRGETEQGAERQARGGDRFHTVYS